MILKPFVCVLGLVSFRQVVAQSSLYPAVDSVLLAKAFNVSLGCLEALNETVSCDATLLRMAGSFDDYLWDKDNVTALCATDCVSTTTKWFSDVSTACLGNYMNVNARFVPPYTIPGRVLDGMNIACLTPDTDVSRLAGVNGTEITSTSTWISNSTVPIDTTVPSPTSSTGSKRALDDEKTYLAGVDFGPVHDEVTRATSGSSGSGYCLIDSYDWVGSDIIRPDCSDSASSDPQCLDPTDVPDENERIANLYSNDVLCSNCFLKMFYLRVASPYLPDLDYSDYLLEQYLDIVDVCQAAMPELLVRTLPDYSYVNGTWDGQPEYNSTTSSATVTCSQNITMANLQSLVAPDPTANGTIYCDALSNKYNVTTGDLQLAFGTSYCTPAQDFTDVCLPAGCSLTQVQYNSTCQSVVDQLSASGNNVTTTQLLTWNPNLVGLCDSLMKQYICIGAPGGSYISPPAANSTSSDAGQQRGGGSGDSTGSGVGGGRNATVVPIGGKAPSPTQSGISSLCTEYVMAEAGDGCSSLSQLWAIPQEDFYLWNPVLGSKGEKCNTQLFSGYYYCIDILRTSTTTSATPTSNKATAPGPTQPGIIGTCNKFAQVTNGQGCEDFAKAVGITPAQLYGWNSVLGVNGANCNTQLWNKEYYCVGVSSSTTIKPTITSSTSTTSIAVAAPGPTQSGIIKSCSKYAPAPSGSGCEDFANAQGITPAQLYTWNTVLGANGVNCNTQLWAKEYYCVGVSS